MLPTGERLWWDDCSDAWITGVAGTGTPFNTRLVPDGLAAVPGLAERLEDGGRIIDGDAHTIDLARRRIDRAGLDDLVDLLETPLEEMEVDQPAALVVNNTSMHECRDIDAATRRVVDALEPGGWFVISDLLFPQDDDGLRTVPGQIMAGIRYFEAQIDDQLLPRSTYDELLSEHSFVDIGHTQLMPLKALTWGRLTQRSAR